MPYKSKLSGCHVLILGGTSGIGYAVADKCLGEGCKISIVSRSREHLNDATERLLDKHHNGNVDRFVADLSATGVELERTLTKIFKDRDVNHVINTTHDALDVIPLERVDTAYIAACAHMTLMVPIMVAKVASSHLVKPMNASCSSMTFTSNSISQKPAADWTVKGSYATALHGMVRCLALDLGPKGIRVNLVSPGPVDTEYYGDEQQRKKMIAEMKKYTVLGKVGTADDVSESYIYLMKDGNATGSIVNTNSGALLK